MIACKKPKAQANASSTKLAKKCSNISDKKGTPLRGSRGTLPCKTTTDTSLLQKDPAPMLLIGAEQTGSEAARPTYHPPGPVYTSPQRTYGTSQLNHLIPALNQSPPPMYSQQYRPPPGRMSPTAPLSNSPPAYQLHDQRNSCRGCGQHATHPITRGAAFGDIISPEMDAVITAIDEEVFGRHESDLEDANAAAVTAQHHGRPPPHAVARPPPHQPHTTERALIPNPPTSTAFSKSWLYSNSRLPPSLPPLKIYIPTYPILCLAAQFSLEAYSYSGVTAHPNTATSYIPASPCHGTKALHLNTHVSDDQATIAVGIRGSHTLADWATNIRSAPSPPTGLIDDSGNLVHAGFLRVARAMLEPVAARLRQLLAEDPSRAHSTSLLLCGHSAGGAVAALLYMHMVSQASGVASPLKALTTFFKRVHCVTFGAPPVSLLPLQKPAAHPSCSGSERKALGKSLFFSFVNEGDLVVRADVAYIRSLVALYATPAPALPKTAQRAPAWPVPPTTLSCAGRLVVLRNVAIVAAAAGRKTKKASAGGGSGVASHEDGKIEACVTSDEQLRRVVYGDPLMHTMKVYAARIERMAVGAVTADIFG